MVKCAILGGKDNHPYLMILFVCLILCSPESHPHSTSIELASLPTLSAFFMGQSVRFSTWKRILPSNAAPSGCTFCYKTVTLEFYERERKENWSTEFTCQFLHQGFRKVTRGVELCLQIQKDRVSQGMNPGREHGGSWWASGPEGQRFIPLSVTHVHCNSIKYSGEKTQRSFRLQRSHALIPAKWCRVSRLWSSLAPLRSWGCLVGPAANCSKMKVPW